MPFSLFFVFSLGLLNTPLSHFLTLTHILTLTITLVHVQSRSLSNSLELFLSHCHSLTHSLTQQLGVVDCGKAGALCERFNIKSYPTIQFVRGGESMPYPNARTPESLRTLDALVAVASRDVPTAPVDLLPVVPDHPTQRTLFVLAEVGFGTLSCWCLS
jgi:hypothetical protein